MAKTVKNGDQIAAGETKPAENAPVTDNKGEMKFKPLISGAEFWRFSADETDGHVDGDTFDGYFIDIVKREKDGQKEDQKAGSIIGYLFSQAGTDEKYIIGKSHSIEKALAAAEYAKDKMYRFVFLGKGKTAAGQPFNRFEVMIEE